MSSHWNSPNSASSEENSWRARTFFCSLIVGPTIYFRKRASSSQRYSEFTRPHFRAFSDIAPHGDDDDDDVDDRPHQTRPAQRWKLNQEGRNERRREEGQKWERERTERKTERQKERQKRNEAALTSVGRRFEADVAKKKLKLSSSTFCLFLLSNFFLLLLPSLIEKLRGRLRIKWILYVENSLSLSFFLSLSLSHTPSSTEPVTYMNRLSIPAFPCKEGFSNE